MNFAQNASVCNPNRCVLINCFAGKIFADNSNKQTAVLTIFSTFTLVADCLLQFSVKTADDF